MHRVVFCGIVLAAAVFVASESRAAPDVEGSGNSSARAEDTRLYKHTSLDFQFTAPEGWLQQPRPEDNLIYEVADPPKNIHVVLWYTSTEQSGVRYLKKMAGMKDLIVDREPEQTRIDDLDAWVLSVPGTIAGSRIHTILAVIPCGRSRVHPSENALYIVQIWCPRDHYERYSGLMADILHSTKIMTRVSHRGRTFSLYPETLDSLPDLPSPFETDDGREFVVAHTKGGEFVLLPITVENGAPLDYNRNQWNKGRQPAVDAGDFPTLARLGLHSEAELERTTTITGRPIADITSDGRPGSSSRTGFMADDEDILSVLRGDNRLVTRLGLTHPQLAGPLFHVFNVALRNLETYRRGRSPINDIEYLLFNGHKVFVDVYGSKGWQESIFSDEVLGYFQLQMWRNLEPEEEQYLKEQYSDLDEPQFSELMKTLSSIQTGEMVPFYIMRYGFYEGHTDYRADPISIASVFGLMSIPKIDEALGGNLYEWLTRHHTARGVKGGG